MSLGLLAGEGELPLCVLKNACEKGLEPYVYAMEKNFVKLARQWVPAHKIRCIHPGQLRQNLDYAHEDGIDRAVMAGKVNKWIFFRAIKNFDSMAFQLWQSFKSYNDDAIMLGILGLVEKEGITIDRQTDYLSELFLSPGIYTQRQPTVEELHDIKLGASLAKEMGRLDVGQTVVTSHGMVLAIEAIEGTDQAILRSRRWAKSKGGVMTKVEKPNQDLRFDVPTVGPRTLKAMKKAGLKVMAVEAGKTLVLEREKLIRMANDWQMTLISV